MCKVGISHSQKRQRKEPYQPRKAFRGIMWGLRGLLRLPSLSWLFRQIPAVATEFLNMHNTWIIHSSRQIIRGIPQSLCESYVAFRRFYVGCISFYLSEVSKVWKNQYLLKTTE